VEDNYNNQHQGEKVMKNKIFKRIISFAAMAIFLMPIAVRAQIQTHYEQIPQFSKEELAQMLAPIALYPDTLLSQILIAASYPFEVAEADRFLASNPNLSGEYLEQALLTKDWDVSVLSLCYYPKIIGMMSENLTWTATLGDAFVYQQQELMDMIQELRTRAAAQGNLTSTNEQRVIVEERIIRIEPAYYNYVYVPVYDPFVVYGSWWYPAYMPFRIFYPGVVYSSARIVFSPRLFIGFGVVGWSLFDWHARNVVIVNIDRTKRYNRNYHVYHKPQQRIYWKPIEQKRVSTHWRAKEIPNYRPLLRKQTPKTVAPAKPVLPKVRTTKNQKPAVRPQTQHPSTRQQVVQPKVQTTKPQQPTVRTQAQPPNNRQQVVQPKVQTTKPQQPTVRTQAQPPSSRHPAVKTQTPARSVKREIVTGRNVSDSRICDINRDTQQRSGIGDSNRAGRR